MVKQKNQDRENWILDVIPMELMSSKQTSETQRKLIVPAHITVTRQDFTLHALIQLLPICFRDGRGTRLEACQNGKGRCKCESPPCTHVGSRKNNIRIDFKQLCASSLPYKAQPGDNNASTLESANLKMLQGGLLKAK